MMVTTMARFTAAGGGDTGLSCMAARHGRVVPVAAKAYGAAARGRAAHRHADVKAGHQQLRSLMVDANGGRLGLLARAELGTNNDSFHRCGRRVMGDALICRAVGDTANENPDTIESEKSDMVNEQLLFFIFQMELDTQLQRALNMEAFDAAKQIRQRREQIDEAVAEFESTKQGRSGTSAVNSSDVRDTVSEGLLLRSDLNRAIEEEDYATAARIRDELAAMEEGASMLEASMEIERWDVAQPLFEIGQRFVHATKGYHGVIVGWDRTCCEDDAWRSLAQVDRLARRENQPFYHVLVDQNNSNGWARDPQQPPVAYVAEELVKVPKDKTWKEIHGDKQVSHPYSYLLFFGMDAQGGMIPASQLRDRYNQERRDVWANDQDGWDDGEADDEEAEGDSDGDDISNGSPDDGGDMPGGKPGAGNAK